MGVVYHFVLSPLGFFHTLRCEKTLGVCALPGALLLVRKAWQWAQGSDKTAVFGWRLFEIVVSQNSGFGGGSAQEKWQRFFCVQSVHPQVTGIPSGKPMLKKTRLLRVFFIWGPGEI